MRLEYFNLFRGYIIAFRKKMPVFMTFFKITILCTLNRKPDLAILNTGHLAQFGFQINNKQFTVSMFLKMFWAYS